jgi:hypothetical protein
MKHNDYLCLGAGAARAWDNMEAALDLANSGECDYLVFDSLTEKNIVQFARNQREGRLAWDPHLEKRMRKLIPACAATNTRIMTNIGGGDPHGAAIRIAELCAETGAPDRKVVAVVGDDVLDQVRELDPEVNETGQPVSQLGDRLVGATAYTGAVPLAKALGSGADIVVAGRAGDSPQYLAPMIHEFGWALDDWDKLAKGLGVGHIVECAGQASGGYFADPPYKVVPDLHLIGFPMLLMEPNGDATITKLPNTGGVVNRMTCLEQLVYEIGDPADYRHNDAIVDFTTTEINEIGPNRVRVTGTSGHCKPPTVLVCLAVDEGYFGMGKTSYGGDNAYQRAQLAADVIKKRLEIKGVDTSRVRFDYIGVNSIFPWKGDVPIPKEVMLRVVGIFPTHEEAHLIFEMVLEMPCNGPTGSTWSRLIEGGGVEKVTAMYSTLIPQEDFHPKIVEI